MAELATLVGQFGVPIALVIFFVVNGQKREARQIARQEKLEEQYRLDMVGVLRSSTSVIEEHTHIMRDLVEAVKESNQQVSVLLTRMGERPCLIQGDHR